MVFEVIATSATRVDPAFAEPTLTEPGTAPAATPDRVEPDGPDRPAPTDGPGEGGREGSSSGPAAPAPVATAQAGAPAPGVTDLDITHVEVQGTATAGSAADAVPAAPPARRAMPRAVIGQLLRSAVSLQAEGVLRTAGALAGVWGGVLDRTEWIERDARDLSMLAAAAVAAQVPLPAGVDTGAADPGHPGSVVESLLAGHEALVRVLRQLADAPGDDSETWRSAVRGILSRREEEILLLRAVGASGRLPVDEQYIRGRPPRA